MKSAWFYKNTMALLIGFFCSTAVWADILVVTDSVVKKGPPNSSMMVGYATIKNQSDHSVKLLSVKSKGFKSVEMHETTNIDGISRMREVSDVEIPEKTSVFLEPGGLHLMFFQEADTKLDKGDEVIVNLEFDNGVVIKTPFKVQTY